jgi:DNA mismatch repair protein MutL
VNVHPSKLEVKFEDERPLFGFVKKGVWNALDKNDLVVSVKMPAYTFGDAGGYNEPVQSANILSSSAFTKKSGYDTAFTFKKHSDSHSANIHEMFNRQGDLNETAGGELAKSFEQDVLAEKIHKSIDDDSVLSKNEIWQFQKKYIMYQLDSTLMIIDQHAAHERILYEQAVDRLNSNANLSQQLLIPIYIELNPVDYEVVKTTEKELKALGFDIEIHSKRKVKIKGIPSDVRIGDEGKILQDLVDQYKEYDVKLNLEKRDNLAKSYACKHAIKAGDHLSENEMLNLIDKLFSVKMPYVCPHGRPTIVKISMDELDKMFARTGF